MPVYWYDIAQICMNGHLVNPATIKNPEASSAFCRHCDAPTIKACPHCNKPIRGLQYGAGESFSMEAPPSFCYSCGKFFPWGKKKEEQEDVAIGDGR
ncbi:MAG: DUF2321 domain-containing protein [Bacillota bacterium]